MNARIPIRVSVLGYLLMLVALLCLIAFNSLLSPAPIVVIPQLIAIALMVWSRLTLRGRSFHPGANPTPGELITSGPYRYTRNPIYLSVVIFVTPAVFAYPSYRSFALLLVLLLGVVVRVATEEHLLSQQYPGFRAYCQSTKRFIPFLF